MGLYVVKSKTENWWKIGHHKITNRRPNVYFRFIRRGFYSCVHPDILNNKLGFEDVELIFWFPNLNTCDELDLHKFLSKMNSKIYTTKIGEWYENIEVEKLYDIIINKYNGYNSFPSLEDLEIAKQWIN